MRFLSIMFVILLSIFVVMGCQDKGQKDKSVLARIDGEKITKDEFDAYLDFKRIKVHDEKQEKRLLKDYVDRIALAKAIEKEKLLDEKLINAEFDEFKKEMIISRYFEKLLKDKVSKDAVKNYYNTHEKEYEQKRVQVAHILFRTNKRMTEPEIKAKLTSAQEAYSKLESGEDFGKVAELYSEDKASSKKGGDLGWIKEGGIDPRFSKIVFEMKPGEISKPFKTAFGYQIAKLIEGPKIIKRPFRAVRGEINYQLRNKTKEAEMERLVKKLKIKILGDKK